MDTRDYLAGQALAALIIEGAKTKKGESRRALALQAYAIADEMMAVREEPRKEKDTSAATVEHTATEKLTSTPKSPKL